MRNTSIRPPASSKKAEGKTLVQDGNTFGSRTKNHLCSSYRNGKGVTLFIVSQFGQKVSKDCADGLEKRKKALQNQLKAVNLTAEQRISIKEFAARVRTDLATIEDDFESKRELLDLLNLQITLDIIEYKRRGFVTCKIGRLENLPITYTLSKSYFRCIRVA